MDCSDHKNGEAAYCPSCLASYWMAQFRHVKQHATALESENAALRAEVESKQDEIETLQAKVGGLQRLAEIYTPQLLTEDEMLAIESAAHDAHQKQQEQTSIAGLAHYTSVEEVLRNLLERNKR